MNLSRRGFLNLATGAAVLPVASYTACAFDYPTRPVHIVVGYPAGGPQDIVARLIGQWLSGRLGQQFVVDNRSGAGGNIAAEVVVNALPDGYTLLLAGSPNVINISLYDKLSFVFLRDIAPVAAMMRVPLIFEVHPSLPVTTVSDFIAYVRANPGKINFASAGIGTPQHVAGELFKMMTGVNMLHVPYRGAAPALVDMVAGEVQVMFDTSPASIPLIRAGKLRPLAVTTRARWEGLPDIPTVSESVPGYEANSWYGVGAPRTTPSDIVDRLNKEINAGLADPMVKARLADLGGTMLSGAPAEFGQLLAEEAEKWAKVVKFANIKPDG
jgi:tripartite-type tricarboxylate transporter receptor subunit TctC